MVTLVIPFLNEEENLPVLYERLKGVLEKNNIDHELLFFNDGSTDNSVAVIKNLAKKDRTVRLLSFSINRGKSSVLPVAFAQARGEFVITMDADLQDNPTDIPKFIAKIQEGYDCVAGWRKNRKDKPYMVIPSRLWNKFIHKFWGLTIHDYNCGFKIYTSEAAKSLHLYGGMHRFIPMLLQQQGYRVGEVVVDHHPRLYGKSKYGFKKIFKDWPDMMTVLFVSKFIKRPMHFFGVIGGISFVVGFSMLSYLTFIHYIFNKAVGTRPSLIIGVLLVIVGVQVVFTGLLADMFVYIQQNNTEQKTPFRTLV